MKNTRLEKHKVCKDCYCVGIGYNECRCVWDKNYPVIELEFEVCKCCGNIIDDGNPADSKFNKKQLADDQNNTS